MRRFVFVTVGLWSLACGGMMEGMEIPGMEEPAAERDAAPADAGKAAEPAPAADAGGAKGNAAACRKYIETLNGLACMSAMPKQDPAMVCSDALDMMPCDVSKYYNCMAENSKCNGQIPDMAGTANCGTPTCN